MNHSNGYGDWGLLSVTTDLKLVGCVIDNSLRILDVNLSNRVFAYGGKTKALIFEGQPVKKVEKIEGAWKTSILFNKK